MNNDDERIIRESAKIKDKRQRRTLKILGLMFLFFLVAMVAAGLTAYLTLQDSAETLQTTAEDGTELAQQIQQQCDSPGVTDPDLQQFCNRADTIVDDAPDAVKSDPVPGPPGVTGSPGEQGAQGETGATGATGPTPTTAQVSRALLRLCTTTDLCRGQDGADGANATPALVAVAVDAYCNSRGECRGPTGAAGTNGTNGTNGQNGSDAPPITDTQLKDAVDAYCAENDGCRGPTGATGAEGPPGTANIVDNCDPAPEGQVIDDINYTYDADTQIGAFTCTYKEDQTGLLPTIPEETPNE